MADPAVTAVLAAGVAGRVMEAGGIGGGAAGVAAGKGWRGPERIWPGRGGGGAGLAGIGPVRKGGCTGAPPPAAKGGRIGAEFIREFSSTGGGETRFSPGETAGGSAAGEAALCAGGKDGSGVKGAVGASSSSSNSATATEDVPRVSVWEMVPNRHPGRAGERVPQRARRRNWSAFSSQ